MKTVSVIGSCVCRDLFEKDNGENFSFHTDIRFSSPISMLSEPVNFVHADFETFVKDVKVVNGKWYRKNLINDINKTAFKALEENHGEYLILDFAESRISLAEISWPDRTDKLLVSYSTSFRSHYSASFKKNIFKNARLNILNPLTFNDEFWIKTVKDFANKLLKIFDEEKIILIRNKPAAHFVDYKGILHPYFSKDHFNSIILCKILLDKLDKTFIDCCPKCKVVEIPNYALGYQKHKWGNHPFHFTQTYYDYLLDCIKAIVLENRDIHSIFEKYSLVFKNEYDEIEFKTALEEKCNDDYGVFELLNGYEDFNHLGKKQKAIILYALDRKNLFKDIKKIKKEL